MRNHRQNRRGECRKGNSSTFRICQFLEFLRNSYDRDSSSWYKNYYNVGYSNAKTGASLGWKTNIESWDTFGITPPANTKVAVRASMYSDNPEVESGNWDIDVFAFCEILNS